MNMNEKGTSDILRQSDSLLPAGDIAKAFGTLPEKERNALVLKVMAGKIDLSQEAAECVLKSNIAQADFNSFASNLNTLSSGRKLFSAKIEGATGSGTYSIKVKGIGW